MEAAGNWLREVETNSALKLADVVGGINAVQQRINERLLTRTEDAEKETAKANEELKKTNRLIEELLLFLKKMGW